MPNCMLNQWLLANFGHFRSVIRPLLDWVAPKLGPIIVCVEYVFHWRTRVRLGYFSFLRPGNPGRRRRRRSGENSFLPNLYARRGKKEEGGGFLSHQFAHIKIRSEYYVLAGRKEDVEVGRHKGCPCTIDQTHNFGKAVHILYVLVLGQQASAIRSKLYILQFKEIKPL